MGKFYMENGQPGQLVQRSIFHIKLAGIIIFFFFLAFFPNFLYNMINK